MPSVYTHQLIAREVWRSLPVGVREPLSSHRALYDFGANGPDFCFFYPLRHRKISLGAFLHHEGGVALFRALRAFYGSLPDRAYALGFITHYAADITFHPPICAVASSLWQHSRIEQGIDVTLAARYGKATPKRLTKKEESELFPLYAAIAAKKGLSPLRQDLFSRSIFAFNAYLPTSNALTKPIFTGFDSAQTERLFLASVSLSMRLIEEFLHPSISFASLFGKDFLTGKSTE